MKIELNQIEFWRITLLKTFTLIAFLSEYETKKSKKHWKYIWNYNYDHHIYVARNLSFSSIFLGEQKQLKGVTQKICWYNEHCY